MSGHCGKRHGFDFEFCPWHLAGGSGVYKADNPTENSGYMCFTNIVVNETADRRLLSAEATRFIQGARCHSFHTEYIKKQGWNYNANPVKITSRFYWPQKEVSVCGVIESGESKEEEVNVGDGLSDCVRG